MVAMHKVETYQKHTHIVLPVMTITKRPTSYMMRRHWRLLGGRPKAKWPMDLELELDNLSIFVVKEVHDCKVLSQSYVISSDGKISFTRWIRLYLSDLSTQQHVGQFVVRVWNIFEMHSLCRTLGENTYMAIAGD